MTNKEPIKSPYANDAKTLPFTKEKVEEVCKILGVTAIFIAGTNRESQCDHANCMGHPLEVAGLGFNPLEMKLVLEQSMEVVQKEIDDNDLE